jgi:hypothetical protein
MNCGLRAVVMVLGRKAAARVGRGFMIGKLLRSTGNMGFSSLRRQLVSESLVQLGAGYFRNFDSR